MQTTAKTLSDVPAINRFLSYCRVRTVPSKTVMIHAGDLPDVLYYIVDGSVEVMIEDEDGNEMVLAYLNKGQFFGELGLFDEQPIRSACLAWCLNLQRSSQHALIVPIANWAIWLSSMSQGASHTQSWTFATNRTR
jgi:CRP-like cAMP-binding protein